MPKNLDIFCHIRHVAACVAKLVLESAFGTPIIGERGGQRWYHLKERWRFPIGSPFVTPLHYLTIQLQLAVDVSDAQIKMGSLWSKI